ncbi:MAG: ComEC/Rec2 family competence protein [Flavobacteriales bacterium]|nr:ComEC/Rec2 family competence protein [Flavobacteriales bacterium]MCB9166491.1 ComEC/Rec2 family competence protein [Flavobacteriales bacterium]
MAVGRYGTFPQAILAWSIPLFALLFGVLAIRRTAYAHRWLAGTAMTLLLFQMGAWRMEVMDRPRPTPPTTRNVWLAEVQGAHRRTPRSIQLRTTTIAYQKGGELPPDRTGLLLTLKADTSFDTPRAGDVLVFRAALRTVDRVPDPGGFDRASWLRSMGITHEAFVAAEGVGTVGHRWKWSELFDHLRRAIGRRTEALHLAPPEQALLEALLIGARDDLERDQKDAFVRSGTMHVLAVSGMHVGILYLMLAALLRPIGRSWHARGFRGAFLLVAVWTYAGLTGASPSVLRATVICSIFIIAEATGSRADPINSLFGAAFLLVNYEPLMLGQLSFQLSFLAVLGIVLFYRSLVRSWSPDVWLLRQGWRVISVSIAAQLTTLPLTLFVFKAFPTWFLPANVVVVGLVPLALYSGLGAAVVHGIPVIGPIMTQVASLLLHALNWTTALFASLPAAYPAVRIDAVQAVTLFVGVMLLAMRIVWRKGWAGWAMGVWAILFLGLWRFQIVRSADHRQFTLADARGATVPLLQVGGLLVRVADRDTVPPKAGSEDHALRYAKAMGVSRIAPVPSIASSAVLENGLMYFADGRWFAPGIDVLFADRAGDIPEGLSDPPDVIVIGPPGDIQVPVVEALVRRGARLVLSPALDGLQRWRIREWCGKIGVPVHDVARNGAFIFVPDDR